MCELEAHGGRVLRLPRFHLRQPGAEWDGDGRSEMVEETVGGIPCYRLRIREGGGDHWTDWSAGARHTLPLLPNRSYRISALLWVEFARPAEVNLGLKIIDGAGQQVVWNLNGIPSNTEGWQRWEWQFVSDPRAAHGVFQILFLGFPPEGVFRIADLAVVELPPAAPHCSAKGEGTRFRGGPGGLPMRVEEVAEEGDRLVVVTTGARYTFDRARDTILAEPRIEHPREVVQWRASSRPAGLRVLRRTDTECVLANEAVSFGVQCDSLVMVVPHEELILTAESRIGGKWNRLAAPACSRWSGRG